MTNTGKWPSFLQGMGIFGAILLAHLAVLWRPFIWDDLLLLKEIQRLGPWNVLAPDHFGFIRPGKILLFSLLSAFFRDFPPGWNAIGIFLIAFNAIMVFRIAREWVSETGAFVAALVFAVHPLQVEAVGWASAVNGSWSLFFCLASLLWMLERRADFAAMDGFVAALLFFGGLLMKEDALLWPVLSFLILRSVLPERVGKLERALVLQGLIAAVFLCWSWYQRATLGALPDPLPCDSLTMSLMAPRTFLEHVLFFFRPFFWKFYDLTLFFGSTGDLWGRILVGWVGLAALLAGAWRWRRECPGISLAIMFSLVALSPFLNILPLKNTPFGVRYLVFASVALVLPFGVLADWLLKQSNVLKATGFVLMITWVGASVWASNQFHRDWGKGESLFEKILKGNPNPFYLTNLIEEYLKKRHLTEALALAREVPEKIPLPPGSEVSEDYAAWRRSGLAKLAFYQGLVLVNMKREEEALTVWMDMERQFPNDIDLAVQMAFLFQSRFERGRDIRDFQKAEERYRKGLVGTAENSETAYQNLGLLLVMNQREPEGVEIWREGLRKFPRSHGLRTNLQIALQKANASEGNPR